MTDTDPPPEDEICDDGIDNDQNGHTDCWDEACYEPALCTQITYKVTLDFADMELGTVIAEFPYASTGLSIPGSRTDDIVQTRFEALDTTGIFAASDEDEDADTAFIRAAHLWHAFNIGLAGDWFLVTFDAQGGPPPELPCLLTNVADKDAATVDPVLVTCTVSEP